MKPAIQDGNMEPLKAWYYGNRFSFETDEQINTYFNDVVNESDELQLKPKADEIVKKFSSINKKIDACKKQSEQQLKNSSSCNEERAKLQNSLTECTELHTKFKEQNDAKIEEYEQKMQALRDEHEKEKNGLKEAITSLENELNGFKEDKTKDKMEVELENLKVQIRKMKGETVQDADQTISSLQKLDASLSSNEVQQVNSNAVQSNDDLNDAFE